MLATPDRLLARGVRHARDRLAAGVQIAGECGYGDLPHFGVLFRKLTGTTPAAYRERWRAALSTGI